MGQIPMASNTSRDPFGGKGKGEKENGSKTASSPSTIKDSRLSGLNLAFQYEISITLGVILFLLLGGGGIGMELQAGFQNLQPP